MIKGHKVKQKTFTLLYLFYNHFVKKNINNPFSVLISQHARPLKNLFFSLRVVINIVFNSFLVSMSSLVCIYVLQNILSVQISVDSEYFKTALSLISAVFIEFALSKLFCLTKHKNPRHTQGPKFTKNPTFMSCPSV